MGGRQYASLEGMGVSCWSALGNELEWREAIPDVVSFKGIPKRFAEHQQASARSFGAESGPKVVFGIGPGAPNWRNGLVSL